jgi:CRISPR-associated endonuclease Csn1
MSGDPYVLRRKGLSEPLVPYELGRAIYHLAKRRHFKGRDIEPDDKPEDAEEKQAKTNRDATLQALKAADTTLGAWLAARPDGQRKRGFHATRDVVEDEFRKLWIAQAPYHPKLREPGFIDEIENTVFAQRPVFWRKSTLGQCRLEPGAELCPKASWISQQRRMLEKLNNLAIAGGNAGPLDEDERAAILATLQTQASMSWPGVRRVLEPLFKKCGESAKSVKFNLEIGDEKGKLLGNPLEAKLADIFGEEWNACPRKAQIRAALPELLWTADYDRVRTQRVVIRRESDRKVRRQAVRDSLVRDFGVTQAQAEDLSKISLPTGWEPYSTDALNKILPKLELGVRFGTLMTSPEAEWAKWRAENFPNREQPTGEFHDKLPSPADREESRRIAQLRNPTVVRTRNELRKVVNNLIGLYGKPDMIRVELARDVCKSKREREEISAAIRNRERERKKAKTDLESNGIKEPSDDDIEKWLLWKEGKERCPYTGDQICFDDLFKNGRYQVEHIWPKSRSLDNSFRNKTLCREDVNKRKGNKTPFEYFSTERPDEWDAIKDRLDRMLKAGDGLSPGKIRRFLADKIPDDFANRQLTDTGYAARQAITFLQKLWPDVGPNAPVKVHAVSGRVTAQLRKRWGLNYILGDDGEKSRADHRHHAIDALVIACAHGGYVKRLSDYYKSEERGVRPHLTEPWPDIRKDAEAGIQPIVVSHRVRKKVSGPLHKETVYGDTGNDETTKSGTYRVFVTRKPVQNLTKSEMNDIRDPVVREIVTKWVAEHGGEPKKAFAGFPRLGANGPEIRKVRLTVKQQMKLMARASTGYSDLGSNHHIAIYRLPNGRVEFEAVSLFEAARRSSNREPIVRRKRDDGAAFVMSLSAGDALQFPDGEKKGVRVVQGVWASGVIVTHAHTDADGSSVWRPSPGSLLSMQARKVNIDPVGRINSAND